MITKCFGMLAMCFEMCPAHLFLIQGLRSEGVFRPQLRFTSGVGGHESLSILVAQTGRVNVQSGQQGLEGLYTWKHMLRNTTKLGVSAAKNQETAEHGECGCINCRTLLNPRHLNII